MRVLFVTTAGAPGANLVLGDVRWLEPDLEVQTVLGAAAALKEIRQSGGHSAVFVAPSVERKETLALITTLRRDRAPLAVVAIIPDADSAFLAPAFVAGADDVLIFREDRLIGVEHMLRRIQQHRHAPPEPGRPHLRVLYAGQDDAAWRVLNDIPFARADRTRVNADGVCPLVMSGEDRAGQPCDVLVVDDAPGDADPLHVLKWVLVTRPDLPVVVLTTPAAGDAGGAALELGAAEVVSKAGTYRRRLVAVLHRIYVRQRADQPPAPPVDDSRLEPLRGELATTTAALAAAKAALETLRTEHDRLLEAGAYERALRDKDRDELASLARKLQEERERRVVLERTLSQTEDQAASERSDLETAHAAPRRELEQQVIKAADRLHQIAHETQVLRSRLEQQLAERVAERDRLVDNALIGRAVFTRDGRLTDCSETFATMLGYPSAEDAVRASGYGAFAGTPDHAHIVEQLEAGAPVDRVEVTARRSDGRPVRVLTSTVLLPQSDREARVERLFVDLTDRTTVENELRFARRLEAAGRLAAEMAPQIEGGLAALDVPAGENTPDRARILLLVKQLLAFSRHQAKPAGFLSLNDAVTRMESMLRQVAGDAIDLQVRLGDVEPVAAGENDIEHLLIDLVSVAAGCLPYGGNLTIATASETTPTFLLRTSLSAIAAGYGVLPVSLSASLARHVARCGGSVQTSDDAGRTSTLHVHLPC